MEQRIQILEQSGVINDKVAAFGRKVTAFLVEMKISQEKMEQFVTHLMMATMRIIGNDITVCDKDEVVKNIINEVGKEHFDKCCEIMEKILAMTDIVFCEEERAFLLIHLNYIIDKGDLK